jgi:hypothetical protein
MKDELPRTEAMIMTFAGNAEPRGRIRDGIVVGSIVLAHLFLCILLTAVSESHYAQLECHWLYIFTAGPRSSLLLSQPLLFAIWAAFAPTHFFHRFCIGFSLCVVIAFIEEVAILLSCEDISYICLDYGMIHPLTGFFLNTAILSIARHISGWQIQADGPRGDDVYRWGQFGIKHLLVLTAIVALALSLIQTLPMIFPDAHGSFAWRGFSSFVITHFLVQPLPAIVFLWCVLPSPLKLSTKSFLIFICVAVDLCTIIFYNLNNLLPPSGVSTDYDQIVYALINRLVVALSIGFTFYPFRFCGYRMIRVRKTETNQGVMPHAG